MYLFLRVGTSDEHLSLIEHLAPIHSRLSAVIVTTPQAVALIDAMKCLSFTRAVNLPLLGLIENMSGYVCPCCGEISNVFSPGGGEEMARREGIKFLGSLPVDTELVTLLDAAEAESSPSSGSGASEDNGDSHDTSPFPLWQRYQQTPTAPLFSKITEEVVKALAASGGSPAATQ